MKLLVILFLLTGCSSPPTIINPVPVHKLDIKWEVEETKVSLSFQDYNNLGVWLHDVKRYMKDQNEIINLYKVSK